MRRDDRGRIDIPFDNQSRSVHVAYIYERQGDSHQDDSTG
jgi:hypothetical protein